jgi:hypothetical protein
MGLPSKAYKKRTDFIRCLLFLTKSHSEICYSVETTIKPSIKKYKVVRSTLSLESTVRSTLPVLVLHIARHPEYKDKEVIWFYQTIV